MGLYRDRPITDVVSKLDLTLSTQEGDTLAASSIAQARQRLTDTPLSELFHLTAQHWTQKEDADDLWHGLRLFAVDGTLFRTPDTSESADHFEYIKHRPDPTLLRSQKVTGIYQEIWGLLIAYNLIRTEMSQIAKEAGVSPLRISVVIAMRLIRDELIWCAIGKPGTIPMKLRRMREDVKQFVLPANDSCE